MSTEAIGFLAGLISLVGFGVYFIDMSLKHNKPSRTSWIIWSIEAIILYTSYKASGAESSSWMPLADVLGYLIITIFLALPKGEGGWEPFDRICLLVAALSLIIWYLTNNPVTTLIMNMLVDAAGQPSTIKKLFKEHGGGESKPAWALFALSCLVNVFAIDSSDFAVIVFPVYLLAVVGITAIIVWKKS
jgi:hypothetical protein